MNNFIPSILLQVNNNPIILNFTWIQGQTFGSTPLFLILTIFSYLSLTFLLSHIPLPPIPLQFLKPISAIHNFLTLLLSFTMAIGCTLSTIHHVAHPRRIICLPPHTPPTGPLFFWAYVFYLSKILEFTDTFLIILSRSFQRLTFLHVYHHSTVLIMCYLWIHCSQSSFSIGVVTNATVHTVMYSYYFLRSVGVGVRPKWKRFVTKCQILQFLFGFVVGIWILYENFGGSVGGCSGMKSCCFNFVFNVSLMALFIDFYLKTYGAATNYKKLDDLQVLKNKTL